MANIDNETFVHVDLGDGARMAIPKPAFVRRVIHDGTPLTKKEVNVLVMAVGSYEHLVRNCSDKEALSRIKKLRKVWRQLVTDYDAAN